MNIEWLSLDDVILMHDDQIRLYGGSAGVRDCGGLEATINRPQALKYYQPETSVFQLAACYATLAKAHCFVDGNKRTAAEVALVFLYLNGYRSKIEEVDLVEIFVEFVIGNITEEELAFIFEKNCVDLT
ncbi:death-on-curing family protein [Gloeocapsa sp. PCC 7428]|uniref:type II toxin-antitoxin system death-on-curing family toxin n=1 Tax=Gloeocapsa sp. PCC 7428 TaxID=1173026 RepID=UPI0002A5EFA4|nr:type II toxin-antitoxin system death-on-curing family toxin [Gloeocapsa sp. PCC 7428]AFZ33182.1 death-on-curing family protein [Gloeocapsa sp. PCC 7428]